MPCSVGNTDSTCTARDGSTVDASLSTENLGVITGIEDNIFANMGWVGFARLKILDLIANANGQILRVTSADLKLSQDITTPDVIDGRIDRTVYQLGPKVVEGNLSMPVIADVDPTNFTGGCVSTADLRAATEANLLDVLWFWTNSRTPQGRLLYSDAEMVFRYANHAAFRYDQCAVNTFALTVTHSEPVSLDLSIIGSKRTQATDPVNDNDFDITPFLSPARILTWNDITVNGIGGCDNQDLFGSAQVREFTFEINNNVERFYSLNGRLFPVDINVSKREITGSLTMMGLADRLRARAEEQQDNFTRKDEVRIMAFIGEEQIAAPRDWNVAAGTTAPGTPIFAKRFTGVIFQIEEMGLSNDVYETTVNWLALGNDQENFAAIVPGASCDFPAWS